MYHSLARGHATAFMNHLQTQSAIVEWFRGPRCQAAMDSFDKSSHSKKPGRATKRILPLLKPAFSAPRILLWERHDKLAIAKGLGAAPESWIFDLSCDDTPLFSERSIFFSELLLRSQRLEIEARVITPANISHHALTRLLERKLCTPGTLDAEVHLILEQVRYMAMSFGNSSLDEDRTYAFLIPYREGALPVVTMYIRPDRRTDEENRHILSVRTYLGPEMISDADAERMGGFQAVLDDIGKTEDGLERLARWMDGNARPWTITAAGQITTETA